MALASATKEIQVPGEEITAVIRRLNHTQLRAAAKARQSEGVGFMREMGGELIKALKDADTEKIKQIQNQQEADISNYDRDTLLKEGIITWTYPVKLPQGTDELDEPTAKFFAEEIFNFSRTETKAEAKNG